MRLLLDTQLLLWAAGMPTRLSTQARALIVEPSNSLYFSVVSIWEVAIKRGLRRPDFQTDPARLHLDLLASGYRELLLRSEHAIAVDSLPRIHKDPFDRILVAQAESDGFVLLTADLVLARYAGAIRMV